MAHPHYRAFRMILTRKAWGCKRPCPSSPSHVKGSLVALVNGAADDLASAARAWACPAGVGELNASEGHTHKPQHARILTFVSSIGGVSRRSGPQIPKNSQKGLPRPSDPECQKKFRESRPGPEKESKVCQNRVFGNFFDTFLETPGRKSREDPFGTFWGFGAQRTPRLLYIIVSFVSSILSFVSVVKNIWPVNQVPDRRFTPLIKVGGLEKHCSTRGFGRSTPLNGAWVVRGLHPRGSQNLC